MMYLVELITTMTLVHNMEVTEGTSAEPLSQSIVSNNNKKKSSDTSSSKSKKTTSSSKKSPTKKSPAKKSPTKKTTTKSSSSSSKRPPPRPTTSRSSSTRPTNQSSSSRPTTKPSSRPSSSSSSQRSGHSSKSYSSTKSQRPSPRPIHPSQRSTSQSKTSQSTAHKNAASQKVKSVHQNQSRTNIPKKSAQPKTSAGIKVHPSHSNSKVKKSSPNISKSSKGSQTTTGGRSPNLSQEQLRERREALQNKKTKTSQPEKSIHDTRPPKHKPNTVPNRGSRYDSTMDRGNTGNRITPSSSKGKGGLTNSQQSNSRVNNQDTNDRPNNRNQDRFSTNRNTGPVVIVVEKPSSTPDGWNPEIHRQSSEEDRHWHPNYWGAGVFYYTEPPQNVYIEEHNYYGDTVRKYEAPKRKCDRRKSLSVGLRGGTLGSQVEDFSQDDISWGGAVGYRLFDPIGLEVSYIKTGEEWTTGLKAPAQISGNLYLFPWTGVSPYITGGISVAEQAGAKNQTDFELPDGYAYGPHGGVGIEWGIGNHISLNAEGRYTKFKNVDATHTQLSAGLNFYF